MPASVRLPESEKKITLSVLRAQVVDEETHKAMLAWHFKKQEQQKARSTVAMKRRSLCLVGSLAWLISSLSRHILSSH